MYYYHTNYRGDVLAITDQNGTIVAEYSYHAWGNILSQSGDLANINPLRYAGYYYDTETKFYYLMNRYYNPEHGVFISLNPEAGNLYDVASQNGYIYTQNNPMMLVDSEGNSELLLTIGAVTLGPPAIAALAVVGLGLTVAVAYEAGRIYAANKKVKAPTRKGNSVKGKIGNKKQPNIKYPGNGPSKSPGKGWEWRGKGEPGSGQGSWYNPKTKESLHSDLNHPEPIGPHWDYKAPDGTQYRVNPNGSIIPKKNIIN